MKKKIINGIMMVALVAATSTSFVSCKDTNEDVRIEQDSKIADLQRRLASVEADYATIGYVDDKVQKVKDDLNTLEGIVNQKADQTALENAQTELQTNIDNVEKEITQLELWLTETFAKLVTNVDYGSLRLSQSSLPT